MLFFLPLLFYERWSVDCDFHFFFAHGTLMSPYIHIIFRFFCCCCLLVWYARHVNSRKKYYGPTEPIQIYCHKHFIMRFLCCAVLLLFCLVHSPSATVRPSNAIVMYFIYMAIFFYFSISFVYQFFVFSTSVFPSDSSIYAHYVFRAFDVNCNGAISFRVSSCGHFTWFIFVHGVGLCMCSLFFHIVCRLVIPSIIIKNNNNNLECECLTVRNGTLQK